MTDEDRKVILARRARFIAAALASAGIATSGTPACGGETEGQQASPDAGATNGGSGGYAQPGAGGSGGYPQPCLSGGAPQACLGALPDGGTAGLASGGGGGAAGEAGAAGVGGSGGEPMPCLSPPP